MLNYSQLADYCELLDTIVVQKNDLYLKRPEEKTLLLVLYGAIITLGTLENTLVIFIILASQNLRNLRNGFIAHLAFSDLLLCLLTAPSTLFFSFNNFWTFGDLSCRFLASFQAANTYISLLTLTAIAMDRVLLTIVPMRWRRAKTPLLLMLGAVWVLSLTVSMPYFLAVGTTEFRAGVWNTSFMENYLAFCKMRRPQVCVELFTPDSIFSKRTYTIVIFISQYIFPLLGLAFAYGAIARRTGSGAPSRSLSTRSPSVASRRARYKPRTVLLLTLLVLVFGTCWLPSNVYLLLDALEVVKLEQFSYIYLHLFGMVTTCVNPVLYGLLNGNVRRTVVSALQMLCPCYGGPETPLNNHTPILSGKCDSQRMNNIPLVVSVKRDSERLGPLIFAKDSERLDSPELSGKKKTDKRKSENETFL